MAAEIGNKYAEKWTKEAVMDTLKVMYESAKMPGIYYIGSALAQVGLYNQWYSEMAEKFKEDEEVSEMIKRIDQAFESKLVGKTLQGDLNPTMAIFTLKNKHQWKDKQEIDQNTNMNIVWNEERTYEK